MSLQLIPGFGAFTQSSGSAFPSFPAPSAVQSVTSPNWTATKATVTTGQADPLGGTEAVSVVCPADENYAFSADGGFTGQAGGVTGSFTSGQTYCVNFFAKSINSLSHLRVNIYDPTTGDAGCYFNIVAGSVGDYRSGGATESNAGITDYGNGWYQCFFSYVIAQSSTPQLHQISMRLGSSTDFDAPLGTVTAGQGFLIWRFQMVLGTNPNG